MAFPNPTHRFRISLVLATCALLPGPGRAQPHATEDPALDQILQKHVDAIGGWRNWNKVQSIRLRGTIERGDETVDFVIIKKRPDKIRATISVPVPGKEEATLQVIRAHDGTRAWTATRLAGARDLRKEPLDPAAARELKGDAGVLPDLIKLWQAGAHLTLRDSADETPDKSPDASGIVIRAVPDADNPDRAMEFHLSPETFRTQSYTVLRDGRTVSQTWFSDYATVSGITLPRKHRMEDPRTGTSLMRVHSIDVGVGIYRDYFQISESDQGTQ